MASTRRLSCGTSNVPSCLRGPRVLFGAGTAVGVERLGERHRNLLGGLIFDVPPLENELELPIAQESDAGRRGRVPSEVAAGGGGGYGPTVVVSSGDREHHYDGYRNDYYDRENDHVNRNVQVNRNAHASRNVHDNRNVHVNRNENVGHQ